MKIRCGKDVFIAIAEGAYRAQWGDSGGGTPDKDRAIVEAVELGKLINIVEQLPVDAKQWANVVWHINPASYVRDEMLVMRTLFEALPDDAMKPKVVPLTLAVFRNAVLAERYQKPAMTNKQLAEALCVSSKTLQPTRPLGRLIKAVNEECDRLTREAVEPIDEAVLKLKRAA